MTLVLMTLLALSTPNQNQSPDRTGPLFRAEVAFSNASEQSGMAAAFLQFLAEDALLMRPNGHLNGRELYSKQNPPGTLIWRPELVVTSAAGDLGYSTGPYQYTRPAREDDEQPATPSYGRFVSIWRKNAAGVWEVVYDGGIFHKPFPRDQWTVVDKDTTMPKAAANPTSYSDARANFEHLAATKNLHEAFLQYASKTTRLYEPGRTPAVGMDQLMERLTTTPTTLKVEGGAVAKSDDLAYAYGVMNGSDEKAATLGFLSIWERHTTGDWRLVLHLINPRYQ